MRIKNRHKIVFLIAIFLLHRGYLSAEIQKLIVGEIVINGNKNIPAKKIMSNISLRKGDEYDAKKTSSDIAAIYEMDKFDDVSVFIEEISTGTVRVIYKVEEKALVKKIEFKGNEEIKSKKLSRKIELKEDEFFDRFVMREDAKEIEDYYKKKGFAECRVEAYTTEDEDKVIVTFYVKEGNKIEIAKINLVGVVKESYKKLIKQIKTKEGKIYKQDLLKEDIDNIRTYYKNKGYLNVEVDEPMLTFEPEHKYMYITFFIYEGKKYFIDGMDFKGNEHVPDEELREIIKIKEGDVYSEKRLKINMSYIQELYGKKGYIRMGIIPNYLYNNIEQKVRVEFEIYEGPKVYIRNIYLDGNFITKDYVIKREFKVKEGDPFDLEKVRKSQAEIYKLGFFKDVKLDMLPAGSPSQTDLVFIVDEQKTGMASVGAGYSSQDKLVGTLRVTQSNFLGRGQSLSVMWEFGARTKNYRIDFTEPYLFNTPTPFSMSMYNTLVRRYYKDFRYDEQRRGGSLSFGRHFSDEFSSFLKYSLEQIKINNISESIRDEVVESVDTTSSITPSASYDSRDYPFNPRTGYLLRGSNQIAGGIFGGTRDFIKFEFQGTYFQPIFWKFIGVFNINTGAVAKYSDSEDVPIYEKFNVGGADTIRGYEFWGEIGPREGGNYKLVTNVEIKFPIVAEGGQTILQGAFFYDIGSTWKYTSDIILKSGLEENKLKRGYGFGIRFKMRAFPIRLDWGYGIDKRPKGSQWYFSLGDIF